MKARRWTAWYNVRNIIVGAGVVLLLLTIPAKGQPFPGGLPACQAALDTCITDLAACEAEPNVVFPGDGAGHGAPLSYTDNGDGTTTDNNTGFMWEQKLEATDPACMPTVTSVHCVDNTYTWTATDMLNAPPNGTAFTVFLDAMNNRCDGDETTPCAENADCVDIGNGLCGHAGYRDWYIPNIRQLESIVDYGTFNPAVDPSFPGAVASDYTWSSTVNAFSTDGAWNVDFNKGIGNLTSKTALRHVRAIRGGP